MEPPGIIRRDIKKRRRQTKPQAHLAMRLRRVTTLVKTEKKIEIETGMMRKMMALEKKVSQPYWHW